MEFVIVVVSLPLLLPILDTAPAVVVDIVGVIMAVGLPLLL